MIYENPIILKKFVSNDTKKKFQYNKYIGNIILREF